MLVSHVVALQDKVRELQAALPKELTAEEFGAKVELQGRSLCPWAKKVEVLMRARIEERDGQGDLEAHGSSSRRSLPGFRATWLTRRSEWKPTCKSGRAKFSYEMLFPTSEAFTAVFTAVCNLADNWAGKQLRLSLDHFRACDIDRKSVV